MKLSRRQLRRLINECANEASNPQYLNENMVNFNRIRSRIEKLEANPGDSDLRAKLEKDRKDLKLKASDRKHSIFKTRYREAQTLLRFLEEFLNSQDEAASEAAEKAKAAAAELEQAQEDGGGDAGGDGGGFVKMPGDKNWEYALRDCVWYTRKAGSTKEYKLGSTSTSSGKFAASISKLNSRFPDMVSGCSTAGGGGGSSRKKPTPTPSMDDVDPSQSHREIIDRLKEDIVYGYNSPCGGTWSKWENHIAECLENCLQDNGASLRKVASDLAKIRAGEREGKRGTLLLGDHFQVFYRHLCYGGASTAAEMYNELIFALQQEAQLSGFPFSGGSRQISESRRSGLSRGSLYRNRYRRY